VRVLMLTRDGRGVLYSDIKRNRPRKASVSGWLSQNTRALYLLRKHVPAAHLMHVKYETLMSDTDREITRICRFLDVDFDPAMLDFAAVTHHSTHGNELRMKRSAVIRTDDQWKERLSADDLRYFERRAGWLNRDLGYT
jgi:Sulfotransferase family